MSKIMMEIVEEALKGIWGQPLHIDAAIGVEEMGEWTRNPIIEAWVEKSSENLATFRKVVAWAAPNPLRMVDFQRSYLYQDHVPDDDQERALDFIKWLAAQKELVTIPS